MGGCLTFKKEKNQDKSRVLERYYIVTPDDTTNTRYVVSDDSKKKSKNGICHSFMKTQPGQSLRRRHKNIVLLLGKLK